MANRNHSPHGYMWNMELPQKNLVVGKGGKDQWLLFSVSGFSTDDNESSLYFPLMIFQIL